jgi:hypothetical protein
MNPLQLLGWWKEILIAALVVAIGVQSYRLQGTQAERDILVVEKTERARRDAMRETQNVKNKERTDEETTAARGRAAVVVVRGKPAGTGIKPGKPIDIAASGDDAIVCFDRRRLNAELAGWLERHVAGLNAAFSATAELGNGRFTTIAREGEGVAADYRACRAWALNLVDGPPLVSSAPGVGQ